MARRKIGVTASEMRALREQGLSNRDIALSLDISPETVRRYIGSQGGHMEHLEGFDIKPPKKEETVEKKPSYQPKVVREEYDIAEEFRAEVNHEGKRIYMTTENGDMLEIPFEKIPDILQFLAWVARERITDSEIITGEENE